MVTGLKSKTSRACTGAQKKIIATNRIRNGPKICASKYFPEKTWADQSREFAVTLHSSATRMAYKFTLQKARQNLPRLRDTLKH